MHILWYVHMYPLNCWPFQEPKLDVEGNPPTKYGPLYGTVTPIFKVRKFPSRDLQVPGPQAPASRWPIRDVVLGSPGRLWLTGLKPELRDTNCEALFSYMVWTTVVFVSPLEVKTWSGLLRWNDTFSTYPKTACLLLRRLYTSSFG